MKRRKNKKHWLEVNDGNDTPSFDMVSKNEEETVSPPLRKILTRLKELESIDGARESLKSLTTAVNKLALYVVTLQRRE